MAIATTILSYFQVAFFLIAAERQTKEIRKNLFASILKQNIGSLFLNKHELILFNTSAADKAKFLP